MLKQLFRYYKPQNVVLCIKNQHTSSIKLLHVNRQGFNTLNLKTCFRTFSTNTIFTDHENIYAYNILQRVPLNNHGIKTSSNDVTSVEDFNELLDRNWRASSIGDIVETFIKVKNLCIINKIAVSDHRFDRLIDGLIDNCEHISDEELINLLYCLGQLPSVESYTSHNFHDLWSCLDDICCWKIVDWDINKCFTVANGWHQIHLGKLCDYIYILIDRYVKKADSLTKDQLINIFFYLNVCRKRPVDFEYEYALEKLIKSMDIDEMAVIAMGYFKTKTKIKLVSIQEAMVDKILESTKTIHDISLTAILKILRYSSPFKISTKIQDVTEKLSLEVDRLSDPCCTHLALLSTGIQTYNKDVFKKISYKFVKNIDNIRVKDIERMLNALTMFNYDPKTKPDIYKTCLDELIKRQDEIKKYPRCLICALNYLSLRHIYSYELLNEVLDMEYIDANFGKGPRSLPREIFSLDCSTHIDCPDYNGNRLTPIRKYKAAKWLIEYIPSHDQWKKLTAADKLFLDVIDSVNCVIGNENFKYINHILPHFSRADIVLCKNKKTGKFIEPVGFENYVLGDIMIPFPSDSLEWIAIVILGWNNTIRDSGIPLGHSVMKEEQLRKIGYKPVRVVWNEFTKLSGSMRNKYILNKLS